MTRGRTRGGGLGICWKPNPDMLSPARNLIPACLKVVILEVGEELQCFGQFLGFYYAK